MTVGDLKEILNWWSDDTVIFANLAEAVRDEPAGEYEWHDFTIEKPSCSEQENYFLTGESTYICINVLPEVVGC